MNILELEKFKIEDAINFHDEYNPWLFDGDKLKPVIKKQLETISNDFVEYMGIPDLALEDIIITGSNVAYTYTPHSDIDLHLLVDFSKLSDSDVYRELFNAKKSLYNNTYDITIRDITVELYVQDTAQAHTSLGEYSLFQDKFTRIPTKKRANLDEISAAAKFEKLEAMAIEGLASPDMERVNRVLGIIKRYRQAGLDTHGEFGPENLAFKAIRSKGYFRALHDHKNKLRADQLSLEEEFFRRTFEESLGVGLIEERPNIPASTADDLAMKYEVSKREVAKQIDLGTRIEMASNPNVTAISTNLRREQARAIAIANINIKLEYYPKMIVFRKEVARLKREQPNTDTDDNEMMEASGYIPSEKQKNDPRWSYALTKDVRPDTMQKGAKAMGLGNISRAGVPPLLRPGKK